MERDREKVGIQKCIEERLTVDYLYRTLFDIDILFSFIVAMPF